MDKEKFFREQTHKFASKCRVKFPYIQKDDRLSLDTYAGVWKARNKNTKEIVWILKYNSKVIKKLKKWQIIHTVLHELGHIKTESTGGNGESEYKAEKFAINAIKKYHPEYLENVLCYLTNFIGDERPIYRDAFIKLLAENLVGKEPLKTKIEKVKKIYKIVTTRK